MNSAQIAMLSRMRTPLKDQFMVGEITDALADDSRAGRPQFVITIAPVDGDVPQRDLALRYYLQRVQVGDGPAELGKIRAKAYGFLRATNTEFPVYPKKVAKGVYQTAAGVNLDYGEYTAVCAEVDTKVFEALDALEAGLAGLKGTKVYIKPGKAKMDDSKQVSQFIDRIFGELRDGETYLSEALVDEAKQEEFLQALTGGDEASGAESSPS